MVLEQLPIPFGDWIGPALWFFFKATAGLALFALIFGYLVAAFRHGPLAGGDITFRIVASGLRHFFQLSPRRIAALTRLAVQESLRRRVLVVYAVFVLILLFAGWFLDKTTRNPSTLYLSFVLTATTYLVLLMALFLSAFSLPADIRNRTIFTVVTKPVRPGEIVLGRMIGFSLMGTISLLLMGLLSYFFVVRVLSHTHEVDVSTLKSVAGSGVRTGLTSREHEHRHDVSVLKNGEVVVSSEHGHTHVATPVGAKGQATTYALSGPRGMFRARVPVYGKLRFKDRSGRDVARGVNVGNEWGYRSFIDGGTLAAAIWTFEGVTREAYPDGLPLEMTLRVFRTYQGKITQGILGTVSLKNPADPSKASGVQTFEAKDNSILRQVIDPKLSDADGKPIDLFEDLAPDGKVEVWIMCSDINQYLGAAQADVYLHAHDSSFEGNFVKGYIGIWLQMLLVTGLGVMFSTFLSGPVAMMATITSIIIGFFTDFVVDVAEGIIRGGGPIESLIRLVTQQNVMNDFGEGITKTVVQAIDSVLMAIMSLVANLLPNFVRFNNVRYVADGFDIPADVVLPQIVTAGAYLLAMFIIGYFFLRTREVAA